MRYYVFPKNVRDDWGKIIKKYSVRFRASEKSDFSEYAEFDTEQEATEKCEKLNAMLYPQPYIFIER